jgi:hypothetical protein
MVLVVGTAGFEPATPCSQSQIGQGLYLGQGRTAQLGPDLALSVVVRCRPVMIVVNGTIVARPAGEDDVREAWPCGHQLDRRVRLDPGDVCLVGKGRRLAAGGRWG